MNSHRLTKIFDKQTGLRIRPEAIIGLFLVLSTLAVYWPVSTHEFVGYDDDGYVTENPRVKRGLTIDNIGWALQSTQKSNWHPLTWLSHMLDVELFGMNAGAHHMTSVLFHIFNSLLLFAAFRKMTGRVWPSGFVAAMFALHPLRVESVAWIAERKDVLSTFFWMLTLWSYARYTVLPNRRRYLPVAGFFLLGLMAKPMLVTLPFVLLLLDYWPLTRLRFNALDHQIAESHQRLPAFQLFLEKVPLFLLSLLSCVITFLVQQKAGTLAAIEAKPFSLRIANALVSYVKYIHKMIWPDNLAVLYPYSASISEWYTIGALVMLGGITFLAVRYANKFPWLMVGWLWYLGTLVPVIGFVQTGVQAMADRYTYVPAIGLFIIAAWGGPRIVAGWRYKTKALSIASAAVFIFCITVSRSQVRYWHDSLALFNHALAATSDNYVIHNNLGFELALKGDTDEAIKHYRQALVIHPDFEAAHINLGVALRRQGRLDDSIKYYYTVLSERPTYAGVHHNLGINMLHKGKIDQAIAHFQEALRIKPDYVEVYNSLGAAMVSKGKIKEAIASFRQALRIDPDFSAAKNNLDKLENKTNLKPKITLDFK
jgi:tetratricopeptide (TPR) repeat protein